MTKMKNYAYEDWLVLSVITKHSIERFEIIKMEIISNFIQTKSFSFRENKQQLLD